MNRKYAIDVQLEYVEFFAFEVFVLILELILEEMVYNFLYVSGKHKLSHLAHQVKWLNLLILSEEEYAG